MSTYLSIEVLKRIEQVRTQLFVDHNERLTKADLFERALWIGLERPERLCSKPNA